MEDLSKEERGSLKRASMQKSEGGRIGTTLTVLIEPAPKVRRKRRGSIERSNGAP